MDWVGFPYGDEAQKTVNILLLVASFISGHCAEYQGAV